MKARGADLRVEALIREIERDVAETAGTTGRSRLSPAVLRALRAVPRHNFVPNDAERAAYLNLALGIGYGQTISQPFVVALMTDLLDLTPNARVLEIGTGSGYQAAVLAQIAREVYSVEIIPELAEAARQRFRRLGYRNIAVRTGDGRDGWPEHAPYDAAIVTAASPDIPPALLAQLRVGGRLVMPLGEPTGVQELTLVVKGEQGIEQLRPMLSVVFVPLVG